MQQNRDNAIVCLLEALTTESEGEAADRRRIELGRLTSGSYQSLAATYKHDNLNHPPLISADGGFVITQAADGAIWVWETYTGVPIILQQRLDREQAGDKSGAGRRRTDKTGIGSRGSEANQTDADSLILRAAARNDKGEILIVGTFDSEAPGDELKYLIWRADTGKVVMRWNPDGKAPANQGRRSPDRASPSRSDVLFFSPNGKYLARRGEAESFVVWDISDNRPTPVTRLEQKAAVNSFTFSPDSMYLATTDQSSIRLWHLKSPEKDKVIPLDQQASNIVLRIAFSPDSMSFLTRFREGPARVWSVESGQPISKPLTLGRGHIANGLGPDGKTVITREGNVSRLSWPSWRVGVWDIESDSLKGVTDNPFLISNTNSLRGDFNGKFLSFHRDGKYVLTTIGDGTARLIKIDAAMPGVASINVPGGISQFDYTSDGKIVATLSSQDAAQLWSADTSEPIGKPVDLKKSEANRDQDSIDFPADSETIMALSPDSRFLAKGGVDRTVRVWEVNSDREPHKIPFKGKDERLSDLRFSPNSRLLAIATDEGKLELWDTNTSALAASLALGTFVTQFVFSDDGQYLAALSEDEFFNAQVKLNVWNLFTGTEVPIDKSSMEAGKIQTLAFGGSDRLITGSDDRTARVWDLTNGQAVVKIEEKNGNSISAVALSRDQKRAMIGSLNGVVTLWDIDKPDGIPSQMGNHADHKAPVISIQFSRDATTAVTTTTSWAHLFSTEGTELGHKASRPIGFLLENEFATIDSTPPKVRFLSHTKADEIKILDIDFTSESGVVAIKGEASKLRKDWQKRFALEINGDGQVAPLYRNEAEKEADKAPEEEEAKKPE